MKILRSSTNYLKKKARKYLLLEISSIVAFAIIFPSPFYLRVGNYEAIRITLMLIPVVTAVYWERKYKKYRLGYEGENLVTENLKLELPDDFSLINDIPYRNKKGGTENIDHIILSQRGVLVIETKNHRGKITFVGDDWILRSRKKGRSSEKEFNLALGRSPSIQVRSNAIKVKEIIESLPLLQSKRIWVQGIVVFPNKEAELIPKYYPDQVEVMYLKKLPDYLRNYKREQLSTEDVDKIGKEIMRQAELGDSFSREKRRKLF